MRSAFTRASLAAVAVLCAAFFAPAPASAGVYRVFQCHDDAGAPAEVTAGFFTSLGLQLTDRCAAEAAGQLRMDPAGGAIGATAPQTVGFSFDVPVSMPNTVIRHAGATMSVSAKTGEGAGRFAVSDTTTAFSTLTISAGAWGGFVDERKSSGFIAGTKSARFTVTCDGPCAFASPMVALRQATISLDDTALPDPPRPEAIGLLDGAPQRGQRVLRFAASDADSGVRAAELRTAAGTVLGSTQVDAGCSYTRPAPCPQSRPQEQLTVDTTQLPDGPHVLELWITDAGANVFKAQLPAITVANAPAKVATKAVVVLKTSKRTLQRGGSMRFSGSVTPVPGKGARVVIEAKVKKRWITAAVVRTRKAGAFGWSHRFRTRGAYTFRARLLPTADPLLTPGTSRVRKFKVR